jgi:hypothetical protein
MVWGDSGNKNSYAYTAMSKSSSLASNITAATSPTASSIAMSRSLSLSSAPTSLAEALALEGFKHADVCQYKGTAQILEAINSQSDELISGASSQQYLVFCGVTQSDLDKIDSVRPKYTRVTYYEDINLLIIKLMPTVKQEGAHGEFGLMIVEKVIRMGMPWRELFPVGAGRFKGSLSSKEGDTSYKPCSRDNEADLPTIVIEAGLPESLKQLRCDANWWLVNPGREGGKVMIVVIISIEKNNKGLQIEKWENALAPPRPITRANPAPLIPILIPTLIQQITIRPNATGAITPNEVTGAPLVLHFEQIFLRRPMAPQTDFTFTANELADFATYFWNCVKS